MSFEFEETFKSMIDAAQTEFRDDSEKIRDQIKAILEDEKERLRLIAAIKLDTTATNEEFTTALENEKVVLENATLALEIQLRATAQQAINAAINVFNNALKTASDALKPV